MIVAAHQPYFAPYAGFFAKALLADTLVLMDDVQFPQGSTWLTRNRFKNDNGKLWLSIPVWKKGLGWQKIREVRICNEGRWREKHLSTLQVAYHHAPFFKEHEAFLEGLFQGWQDRLVELNLSVLKYLAACLGIETRFVLLSELGIDAKEPVLSAAVARTLGASVFLAQAGARKFLDAEIFRKAGLATVFAKAKPPVYPQLWGAFLPNLSVFDLLFNCGPAAPRIIRRVARDVFALKA